MPPAPRRLDSLIVSEKTGPEWSKAKRGIFYNPDWQDITLRLDQDVIDWFEEHAQTPGKPHEDINQALMEHIRRARFPGRKAAREAAD